jgi:hypothetical protein
MTRRRTTLEDARVAKTKVAKLLAKHPLVNGVGLIRVGGGYGVKVNLLRPAPDVESLMTEVDPVPVRVEVVGPIAKRS